MVKTYQGYFTEGGQLEADGQIVGLPSKRWAIINVLEDGAGVGEDITTSISTITFEVEESLYREAEKILHKNGMDMTCFINLSLRALIREGRMPFEICKEDGLETAREETESAALLKHTAQNDYLAHAAYLIENPELAEKWSSIAEDFAKRGQGFKEQLVFSQKFDDVFRSLFTKKLREDVNFAYDLWAALAKIHWYHVDDPNRTECGEAGFRGAVSLVSSMLCTRLARWKFWSTLNLAL